MRATTYVCFECRRAVKGAALVKPDWRRGKQPQWRTDPPRCPGCAAPTLDLGHKFKTPRKDDRKQWEKVRRMVQEGKFTFHDYARTPQTLAEVEPFLQAKRRTGRSGNSKSQNARSRPAKVAKSLSGPTFGPARPITPPRPREKRVALAKARAKAHADRARTVVRMPARKRRKKKPS